MAFCEFTCRESIAAKEKLSRSKRAREGIREKDTKKEKKNRKRHVEKVIVTAFGNPRDSESLSLSCGDLNFQVSIHAIFMKSGRI